MFRSFFLGGFDCSSGYNCRHEAIDHAAATQHDRFLEEDYRLLVRAGILAARDGVCWPRVDRCGRYDLSTLRRMVRAGRRAGIDLVYDLFHFGYPDDVDVFSARFTERFAEYCHAVATFVARETDGAPAFTPVNEPSYLSWAAGHAGLFAPHLTERGVELKVALARAALAGARAIRDAAPHARIISVDPICRAVAPVDRPDLAEAAEHFNATAVLESWDMLSGRLHPELGGSRESLGIVGINYYWTNQWELGSAETPLPEDDPRRLPLRALVRGVWERYGGEVLLSETGHLDGRRAGWLDELAAEAEAMLDDGIPLRGICIYPVLGMPHWHEPGRWMRMGLWDLEPGRGVLRRTPHLPALAALRRAQRLEHHPGVAAPV